MAGSPNRGTIPNVNAPDVKAPTEGELGFDRKGHGHIGAGLADPMGAIFALAARAAAQEAMDKRYPDQKAGTDLGNEADAYKHTVWNYLMAHTIGPERAKLMGDAHEIDGIAPSTVLKAFGAAKNSEGARLMDLYNNQVGRHLPRGGERQVIDAMKRGVIRKRPF